MSSATEGPLKVRFEDLQKVRNWSTRKPISRWYTAAEVATHSSATDCWVTISGRVYDVTSLFTSFPAHLYKPILTNGGKDISHWFEPRTFHRDINNNKHNTDNIDLKILLWYHPTRHMFAYFTPQGIFAGMPPSVPCSDFNVDDVPWWMDSKFVIGNLSIYTQLIRIKNILTDHVTVIEIPSEETINEILYRYLEYNKHASSYEFKAILEYEVKKFIALDMNKTLVENGVKDEVQDFKAANMELDYLLPAIHIHYTDDLTIDRRTYSCGCHLHVYSCGCQP